MADELAYVYNHVPPNVIHQIINRYNGDTDRCVQALDELQKTRGGATNPNLTTKLKAAPPVTIPPLTTSSQPIRPMYGGVGAPQITPMMMMMTTAPSSVTPTRPSPMHEGGGGYFSQASAYRTEAPGFQVPTTAPPSSGISRGPAFSTIKIMSASPAITSAAPTVLAPQSHMSASSATHTTEPSGGQAPRPMQRAASDRTLNLSRTGPAPATTDFTHTTMTSTLNATPSFPPSNSAPAMSAFPPAVFVATMTPSSHKPPTAPKSGGVGTPTTTTLTSKGSFSKTNPPSTPSGQPTGSSYSNSAPTTLTRAPRHASPAPGGGVTKPTAGYSDSYSALGGTSGSVKPIIKSQTTGNVQTMGSTAFRAVAGEAKGVTEGMTVPGQPLRRRVSTTCIGGAQPPSSRTGATGPGPSSSRPAGESSVSPNRTAVTGESTSSSSTHEVASKGVVRRNAAAEVKGTATLSPRQTSKKETPSGLESKSSSFRQMQLSADKPREVAKPLVFKMQPNTTSTRAPASPHLSPTLGSVEPPVKSIIPVSGPMDNQKVPFLQLPTNTGLTDNNTDSGDSDQGVTLSTDSSSTHNGGAAAAATSSSTRPRTTPRGTASPRVMGNGESATPSNPNENAEAAQPSDEPRPPQKANSIRSPFFQNVSKVSQELKYASFKQPSGAGGGPQQHQAAPRPSFVFDESPPKKDATSLRRERLGFTMSPGGFDDETESALFLSSQECSREDAIAHGKQLLGKRLRGLNVMEHEMKDDGNCLFRAFSHQFFGTPDHHEHFRKRACQRIIDNRDTYLMFFDTPKEFEDYTASMSKQGTWGDEIVLKALCDHFEVVVYVILSTPGNWYLRYVPTQDVKTVRRMKKVFLSYLSPIHYNSVTYKDGVPITLTSTEEDSLPELKSSRPPGS